MDKLTDMLRMGQGPEVADVWDALVRYMDQPTQDNYMTLREAYLDAETAYAETDEAFRRYLESTEEFDIKPPEWSNGL